MLRYRFIRPSELWETEIRHRTKQLRLQVIFPKSRPPRKASVVEHISRRTYRLDEELKVRLPDGRYIIAWEKKHPRLNERYQLQWEW
jgi:hypothetical protein